MIPPSPSGIAEASKQAGRRPVNQPSRLSRVMFAAELDPSQQFGTMQEQALTLARAFRDRGSLFLPVFVRPADPNLAARYAAEGLRIEGMNLRPFRIATLLRLLRLVRSEKIEIINWNFYNPLANGYLWALSLLAPGVRHYLTDHNSRATPEGSTGADPRWLLKWPFGVRYSKVLCVSDYVLAQVRRLRWRNLTRFHHFVNTERFRPDAAARREVRKRFGAGDRFVALVVAYLIPQKGVDVALRSLAHLPQEVELWVVGGGPEESALGGLARELGVQGRVRFMGPQGRVEPFMQAADCLVCPSVWGEAAGLVNLEAPSCGLPVVASRAGGIPEFIEDGRTGFLFPPGDHRALADRLRRLLEDEPARVVMSREARAVAIERFSSISRIDDHLRLYGVGVPNLDEVGGSAGRPDV
jgi:glycosyltransferase involved in cell wall biosynthesis